MRIRHLFIAVISTMFVLTSCSKKSPTEPQPRDTTPPTISSVTPPDGAIRIPVSTSVTVHFSEAIDPASVTTTSFLLSPSIAGTLYANADSAVFTPTANLPFATTITATVNSGIKDKAGNGIEPYSWSFTVKANTWIATFGFGNNYQPKVLVSKKSGYIMAADYLYKIDTLGQTVWTRSDIVPTSIAYAVDNVGYMVLTNLGAQSQLTYINEQGQTQWSKTVATTEGAYNFESNMSANAYFIIGPALNTGYAKLAKVDAAGNFVWEKTYYAAQKFFPSAIAVSYGDVYVAGTQDYNSLGPGKYCMQVEPTSGTVIWDMSYSSVQNSDITIRSLTHTLSNGIVMAGGWYPGPGANYRGNLELIDRSNSSNNFNRVYLFGGFSELYSVKPISSEFVMTGYAYISNRNADMAFIIKTAHNGEEIWRRVLPLGDGVSSMYGKYIENVPDGGFLVVGEEFQGGSRYTFLVKTDDEGYF